LLSKKKNTNSSSRSHRSRRQEGDCPHLTLGENPGNSEIIRPLNSSISFQICGEDLFLETLINTRSFFKANYYLRSLHFYYYIFFIFGQVKKYSGKFCLPPFPQTDFVSYDYDRNSSSSGVARNSHCEVYGGDLRAKLPAA